MRIVALLLVLGLTVVAWAVSGVDTLVCTATSTPNNWVTYPVTDRDKVSHVALPDDGLDSLIRAYLGEIQRFTLSAPSIPVGATVDSVVVRAMFGSYSASLGIRAGMAVGSDTSQGAEFVTGPTPDVVKWDTSYSIIAAPGSRTWNSGNLDSAEVFVLRSSETYADAWVSSLTAEAHYTIEGGAEIDNSFTAFMQGNN